MASKWDYAKCDYMKSADIGNENVQASYDHGSVVADHWRKEAKAKKNQCMSTRILKLPRINTGVILVRGSN